MWIGIKKWRKKLMKESQWINFSYHGEILSGKILKIYTQIGGDFHNQKMVTILLDGASGLFDQVSITALKEEIELI